MTQKNKHKKKQMKLMLTEETIALLRSEADSCNMTMSDYVAKLLENANT